MSQISRELLDNLSGLELMGLALVGARNGNGLLSCVVTLILEGL